MTRRHAWLIGGLVACVAAAAWFFDGRPREHLALDLMTSFSAATQQPADAFSAIDATLAGRTQPAIFVEMPSRLTFPRVAIPENAWLELSLGLKQVAWTMPGDGVTFFVVISDGKNPEQVLTRDVNPYEVPADRGWRDEMIDLSDYAGLTVDVILNTRAGPRNDRNGDLALWGAPRIVVR